MFTLVRCNKTFLFYNLSFLIVNVLLMQVILQRMGQDLFSKLVCGGLEKVLVLDLFFFKGC